MKADALSQLLDVILDDLSARFIINLPEEELSSVTRICFGLEQAHWFYEDFFRPQYPALPSVNLRAFTAALFSHCPLLWKFSGQHEAAFDDFLKYKIRVPVRGAIMLNKEMDKCVLVKGWKASAGWGFPKGKIDQEEDDADCAVREVREECGFDISPHIRSEDFVDLVMKEQSVRLYVVHDIPLDTKFEPQTRKEISKISWFALDDLPTFKKDATKEQTGGKNSNKYYMVAPFLGPLRRWIKRNRPKSNKKRQENAVTANKAAVPRVSTPSNEVVKTNEPTGIDYNDRASVEASSQALKLLLGIVDAPASAAEDKSAPESAAIHDESKSGSIDLESLFRSPQTQVKILNSQERTTQGIHKNPKVPQSLLNTSIETSILDQLYPNKLPAFHGQSVPSSKPHYVDPVQMHSDTRGTPFSHHQRLPPWMDQHHRPNIPFPMQQMQQFQHRPMPPPDLQHMQQMAQMQRPHRTDIAPPGLNPGHSQIPSSLSASPKKTNPNAQSLLAILKPKSVPTDSMATPGSNPPRQQVDQVIKGPQPLMAGPGSATSVAPGHRQSLLALLKPTGPGIPSAAQPQGPRGPNPHVQPLNMNQHQSISNRDSFLLNYLEQAVNGR